MDYYVPFCKNMGSEIEGHEMGLLAVNASLEANRKMGNNVLDNFDGQWRQREKNSSHKADY